VTIQCNSIAPDVPIELTAGVSSSPFDLHESNTQSFTLAINPGERVTCETTNTTTGDADLYLKLNDAPDIPNGFYHCSSLLVASAETCTVRDTTGSTTLWAVVVAFESVSSWFFL